MAGVPPAVLLGSQAAAVSAARSLGALGVEVYGLGDPTDPLAHSRHCHHFVDVGSKHGVEERYMEWLEAGPRGAVVIPMYDDGLDVISRNRPQLIDWGYRAAEGDDEVNLAMMNKLASFAYAEAAQVPAPYTAMLASREQAERASATFDYPCALKPVYSHLFARHYGSQKLLEVHDPDELLTRFDETSSLGLDMLATEIIPGPDDALVTYYTYLDENGEALFHFTKRKLRQWPVRYGLASYQLSTWDPELAEIGYRFCRNTGIRGIGTVEFKRDPRDGEYKFIECNPRLTNSLELVRRCGIEMAEIAYRRAAGLPVEHVAGYRTNVHAWYVLEDLRALREYRRTGELSARAWARSLLRRQHPQLFSLDDPRPSLASWWRKLGRLRGRLAGPLTPAAPPRRPVEYRPPGRPSGRDPQAPARADAEHQAA